MGDLPFASIRDTFDAKLLKVVDSPSKGQTTRAYINSGAWDELTAQMKSGDFVLIGFKPNSDVSVAQLSADPTAAATQTLKAGDGETFDSMDPDTHKLEHIHNYAWYLRKFVVESISHGANPILCYPPMPPDPTNRFPNNRYLTYPAWIIRALTAEQHIPYLDLTAAALVSAPDLRLSSPIRWSPISTNQHHKGGESRHIRPTP